MVSNSNIGKDCWFLNRIFLNHIFKLFCEGKTLHGLDLSKDEEDPKYILFSRSSP